MQSWTGAGLVTVGRHAAGEGADRDPVVEAALSRRGTAGRCCTIRGPDPRGGRRSGGGAVVATCAALQLAQELGVVVGRERRRGARGPWTPRPTRSTRAGAAGTAGPLRGPHDEHDHG